MILDFRPVIAAMVKDLSRAGGREKFPPVFTTL